MASPLISALDRQVAFRWQEGFNRLNRNRPGIIGMTEYSKVSRKKYRVFAYFEINRRGTLREKFYALEH